VFVLCELRDYFDDGATIMLSAKIDAIVYTAQNQITKISNIVVNLLSIEK